MPSQPVAASIDPQAYELYSSNGGVLPNTDSEAPSLSSLGLIEDMLNTPAQMDWVSTSLAMSNILPRAWGCLESWLTFGMQGLYDSRISGFGPSSQDMLWVPDVTDVSPMDDFMSFPPGA